MNSCWSIITIKYTFRFILPMQSFIKVTEIISAKAVDEAYSAYVTGFAKRYLFHTFYIPANKMM